MERNNQNPFVIYSQSNSSTVWVCRGKSLKTFWKVSISNNLCRFVQSCWVLGGTFLIPRKQRHLISESPVSKLWSSSSTYRVSSCLKILLLKFSFVLSLEYQSSFAFFRFISNYSYHPQNLASWFFIGPCHRSPTTLVSEDTNHNCWKNVRIKEN